MRLFSTFLAFSGFSAQKFGGAVSCSGGADAAELGCSTRLMWRAEGDAELSLRSAGSSRWILHCQLATLYFTGYI